MQEPLTLKLKFSLWKNIHARFSDRKTFEVNSTKDTKIYSGAPKICSREDTYAKNIKDNCCQYVI